MRRMYVPPTVRKIDASSDEGQTFIADIQQSERRRSTRVVIQIPVEARFQETEGMEFRVSAFTLSVNEHGCLLAMDMRPEEGQRMRLKNPKSAVEHTGRVIRAQRARDGSFAVAFEFDSPAPKDWFFLKR
jgi:PilZ domain